MNPDDHRTHVLPVILEKILASLSVYYGQKDNLILQKLLVNSHIYVEEETGYDNWNGGQWFHTLHLQVPLTIYFDVFDNLDVLAEEIKSGIAKLNKLDDEFIEAVHLDLDDDSSLDEWREESGLLLQNGPLTKIVMENDLQRLWEPGFFRVFLSHKSDRKKDTAEIKKHLRKFGISCFVAHEDIEPSKEWQEEIEKALFSMHVLVPLLSEGFHESNWTDQEIGVAIGRGVPVIAVRLGYDPYGFIGKIQAIQGLGKTNHQVSEELSKSFFAHSILSEDAKKSLVYSFCNANSYDDANSKMQLLSTCLQSASPAMVAKLEAAVKENLELRDAFKVQSNFPSLIEKLKK